jgi:hypothetical protein
MPSPRRAIRYRAFFARFDVLVVFGLAVIFAGFSIGAPFAAFHRALEARRALAERSASVMRAPRVSPPF